MFRAMTQLPQVLQGNTPIILEFIFDGLLTLEIMVRIAVCPDRCAFFLNPYNATDFFAGCCPLTLRAIAELHLAYSETDVTDLWSLIFSVVPVIRILKLLRNFEKFHLLLRAFEQICEAMPVLLYAQFGLVLFFGSLIFITEPRDNIATLTESFWYVIVTMTSVGYGDIVPETSLGKTVATMIIVCGPVYMAMPLGIVGASFSEVWAERDKVLVMKRARDRLVQCGFKAEDLPALFAVFDVGKTGELTLPQFRKMIRQMHVMIDDARLLKLFSIIDLDSSGTIGDQEFVSALFPECFFQVYGFEEEDAWETDSTL
jgi:hypothetical protein